MLHDDPRLTTYALGELDALAPDDLREVEELLATDDEARQVVAEVRRTAGTLRAGLALAGPGAALPELTADQQRVIAALAAGSIAAANQPIHAGAGALSDGPDRTTQGASLRIPGPPRAWARW